MNDQQADDAFDDDDKSNSETLEQLNVHSSFGLACASCIASIMMIIAYYCQSSRYTIERIPVRWARRRPFLNASK